MREVSLDFIRENVDTSAFHEDYHNDDNTDIVFYNKSYDGGENHEIHYIYIVGHDEKDLTKPYTIYHYEKEYMWNWHTSFEQEECFCTNKVEKTNLSGVFYYLQEENVINTNFTTTIKEKNPSILVDTLKCKYLKYNISVDWADDMGDYSDLFTFIISIDKIDMDKFNEMHIKLVEYLKNKINIFVSEPSSIINKMHRKGMGPFTKNKLFNNRYCFWINE